MKTISLLSKSNNPDFNLATEEFLFKNRKENIHFFYVNSPSVIIGKHQNALAEVNLSYLEENNIPLYRRLSGGGTVYHDEGNINYCFIKTGETSDLVNFKEATQPIIAVLNSWGIPVRSGQRNDLLLNYKKISGNACHVSKNRVMHHGTLLYNSNLNVLTKSLKNDPLQFNDKAVKSVRSQVVNIKDVIKNEWSSEEFMKKLESSIRKSTPEIQTYELSNEDIAAIEKLRVDKYKTWEWNYGYGPTYTFKKRIKADDYVFAIEMEVNKGKISAFVVKTNYPDAEFPGKLAEMINNSYHEKSILLARISVLSANFPSLPNVDKLIELFF